MRLHFSIPFLLVFAVRSGSAMDHVTAVEGNISLQNSSGQMTVLTKTGLDSDPWLAPDGRVVVFLRRSREDMFRSSVYEIDVETRTVRLVYSGPAKFEGHQSSYFGRPELDESQNTLFLISKEFATTGSLVAIQLPNGQPRLIADHVVGYDIIECLKNRGDIVVLKRHEDILGAPYFLARQKKSWVDSGSGSLPSEW
jgi:hypothetical protein